MFRTQAAIGASLEIFRRGWHAAKSVETCRLECVNEPEIRDKSIRFAGLVKLVALIWCSQLS